MATTLTIHDWQGPLFPVPLGGDLLVVDRELTVEIEDEPGFYGFVRVNVTSEGLTLQHFDGVLAEPVGTSSETWSELAERLEG